MADSDFDTDSDLGLEEEGILSDIATESRRCPPAYLLVDLAENRLDAETAERIGLHVDLCVDCQADLEKLAEPPLEIDDLSWRRTADRLDQKESPWQRSDPKRRNPGVLLLLAASVLAVLGASVYWLGLDSDRLRSEISVVRGVGIVAAEPDGDITELRAFEWALAAPLDASFRVQVEQREAEENGTPVWSGSLESGQLPADLLSLLRPATEYRWRVVAVTRSGSDIATSSWTTFRWLPNDAPSLAPTPDGKERESQQNEP